MGDSLDFSAKRLNSKTVAESLNELVAAVKAAHKNEQITRARVDGIDGLLSRGFIGRLKWLLLGR